MTVDVAVYPEDRPIPPSMLTPADTRDPPNSPGNPQGVKGANFQGGNSRDNSPARDYDTRVRGEGLPLVRGVFPRPYADTQLPHRYCYETCPVPVLLYSYTLLLYYTILYCCTIHTTYGITTYLILSTLPTPTHTHTHIPPHTHTYTHIHTHTHTYIHTQGHHYAECGWGGRLRALPGIYVLYPLVYAVNMYKNHSHP
jgi:hypothetical protein